MGRWLFLLLLLAAAKAAAGTAAFAVGEPYLETVGEPGAIPERNVSALAQDRAGFLWIGTPDGLLRYDGYRMRRFAHAADDPHSLSGNFIRTLLVGRDGRLWVGTGADGVSILDPRTGRFQQLRHDPSDPASLSHDGIGALAEDNAGHVWIGTRRGLDQWRSDGTLVHHREHADAAGALRHDDIDALLVDRSGDLWVGTWNGLYRRRAGSDGFEPVLSTPGDDAPLAGVRILSLLQADDGRLWIGTVDGTAFAYDPATTQWQRVADGPAAGTPPVNVRSIAQPTADAIWLARYGGIDVIDARTGEWRRRLANDPAIPSSLGSNTIIALLKDRSGLLWIGGYGAGLQRHNAQQDAIRMLRHSPSRRDTLSLPSVSSILELQDGTLWFGTRGNGIDVFDRARGVVGGHRADPDRPGMLGNGGVAALAQTADGIVWVGAGATLYRYDPALQTFAVTDLGQRSTGNSLRRLLAAHDGGLWIGTNAGVAYWSQATGQHWLDVADGLPMRDDVNALGQDRHGRLWVGAESGIYTVAPGTRELVRIAASRNTDWNVSGGSIVGLLLDRRDQLWVDTPEGLFRLLRWNPDGAEYDAVSRRHGIDGRPFGANLLEDGDGRIWTYKHVYDPVEDSVTEIGRADGADLGTGWFRAYAQTRDGLLLYGGAQGVLAIDPSRYSPRRYAAPLVASELKIDGDPQNPAQAIAAIALQPPQRSFAIEFAALDYAAPEVLRYEYRLDGYDEDWIATDAGHRIASYTNLWPGRYRLRVRGTDRRGNWSAHELDVPVDVLPRYWQTPWFAAAVVLALLAAIAAGVRWRTARIRARAEELQQLVDVRTTELRGSHQRLQASNAQLEHAHAELVTAHARLIETQQQLVMQEKMASLGNLVAGVAHEVNTPIGIAVTAASHVQESTRTVVGKLAAGKLSRSDLVQLNDTMAEGMRLVLGSLERANTLIASFKQVAVDQSSEQRRRFDLRGFLDEVRCALEPTYKRSPHVFAIDCSDGIEVDTYPGALFQIITNLLNNALLHAFADGQAGRMSLTAERHGDTVALRFRDDGVGMPADVAARAFDPFFTTRRGSGGSGLGLHLVFNLTTQLLGGTIELHTAPGNGTEFVLQIPRNAPRAAPSTA